MDYKERIRALREDNDYTQSRIAGLLNIGQNTYADYELGKTRIPVDSLIKLAQFYNVDMNYITDISKTVHKFPKEKQQLAAVNKRKKIVIPEHTLHCCQFYPIQLSKLNSLDSKFLAYGSDNRIFGNHAVIHPSFALYVRFDGEHGFLNLQCFHLQSFSSRTSPLSVVGPF